MGDHNFLTHSYTPCPTHTLHSGCWAWAPTPPQREPKTHLSSFTALSRFFGLKSKRDRQRQGKRGSGSQASYSLALDPRPTWLYSRKPGPCCGVPPHLAPPKPCLCELRSGAWLAPAFTLAVFFQGHLSQLTAWVPDHEDLCSGEQGERPSERGERDAPWPGEMRIPCPPARALAATLSVPRTPASSQAHSTCPIPAFGLGAAQWAHTPGRRQGSSRHSAAPSHSWAPVAWPQCP